MKFGKILTQTDNLLPFLRRWSGILGWWFAAVKHSAGSTGSQFSNIDDCVNFQNFCYTFRRSFLLLEILSKLGMCDSVANHEGKELSSALLCFSSCPAPISWETKTVLYLACLWVLAAPPVDGVLCWKCLRYSKGKEKDASGKE